MIPGGGYSLQVSETNRAEAGDASAGLDDAFQYNGDVFIGGSGTFSASKSASQDKARSDGGGVAGVAPVVIYAALGFGALLLVLIVAKK